MTWHPSPFRPIPSLLPQVLIRDATALHGFDHAHVMPLLATAWDGTSPLLVFPASGAPEDSGNLKVWLQSRCQVGLSTHLVVSLGLQLCNALQHLHRRKVVHKDVATRNC